MKLRLLAVPAAVAALTLVGTGAEAGRAPVRPQIVDPAGDAVDKQGMHDITSASFVVTKTSTRSTRVVKGRKVTVVTETPKDLVVTLNLGAAAAAVPGTYYEVGAETACGTFSVSLYNSPALGGDVERGSFSECGPDNTIAGVTLNTFDLAPALTRGATSLTWTIAFKSLPKSIVLGKVWGVPYAYASPADPVFGIDSNTFTSIFGIDTALDVATGADFRLS